MSHAKLYGPIEPDVAATLFAVKAILARMKPKKRKRVLDWVESEGCDLVARFNVVPIRGTSEDVAALVRSGEILLRVHKALAPPLP